MAALKLRGVRDDDATARVEEKTRLARGAVSNAATMSGTVRRIEGVLKSDDIVEAQEQILAQFLS